MHRKLSLIEGTMYAGGEIAVNVVSSVTIRGKISETALSTALSRIQSRHPLLSAKVQKGENGIPYFITQNPAQGIKVRILTRATDEDWKKESVSECLTPFDTAGGPLLRLVWLRSENVSDLIFVGHHCICDGRSVLNLIDETLTLLGQPEIEMGSYQPFSSIQDFIPDDLRFKKTNKIKIYLFSKIAMLALRAVAFKKKIKRERPYFIHWKLNQEESVQIIEKCKSENVSVNDALGVAFLRAFQIINKKKSNLRLYCAVDMRKFITEVKNNMLFAFPAMIGLNLSEKKTLQFWDQAREFKAELSKKIEAMDVNTILLYSECLLPALPRMTNYAKADKGSHAFTLSNMGKVSIKEQYNNFEVVRLSSPSTIFPFGNPSTLFTTYFKGQIDFIFTSDEYFVTYNEALSLKATALEMIAKEEFMPAVE